MRACALTAAALVVLLTAGLAAAEGPRDHLIFHAESGTGEVLRSRRPDHPFNPASVVKVGTSLWALQSLGPRHRYRTLVGTRGEIDAKKGVVRGPLVVIGGGDPDFHSENIFLIAAELNRQGIRRIKGGLELRGRLWVGWENGTAKRINDPREQLEVMASRLTKALDPELWDRSAQASWMAMCKRRGLDPTRPPRVEIRGPVGRGAPGDEVQLLVEHLSNPLPELLERFNVYSNNDIIRVAEGLGGVQALELHLRDLLQVPATGLRLETASGELTNRMTLRTVVQMLRSFSTAARGHQLTPARMLPLLGCDPGPTRRMFPRLVDGERARTVVCKTGTLSTTDGGVAVLSGYFVSPEHGEVIFCVAAEQAGDRLRFWRNLEQHWLLDLIDQAGGALPTPCGEELPFSDTHAVVGAVTSVDHPGGADFSLRPHTVPE